MREILTYIAGVVVCSGVFTAFYSLLLHQRTSFRVARAYLVASLLLSALIPALEIPVWKAEPVAETALTVIDSAELPVIEYGGTATPARHDFWPEILWGIYALGATALLAGMFWQGARILRMKKGAKIHPAGEIEIAVSESVHSPFSFLSTIYVAADTPPDEMRQIILHETSHIRHRHSVEKIITEIFKTLMWYNPFAWVVARLLNEVHEFEADRDVLKGGYSVDEYIPVIFRQVFGYIPEISTGLGNSLTKKRFEMMIKNLKHHRYSWLRTAGALPIAAGMLMMFGFTHRTPERSEPVAEPTTTSESVSDSDRAPKKEKKRSVMASTKHQNITIFPKFTTLPDRSGQTADEGAGTYRANEPFAVSFDGTDSSNSQSALIVDSTKDTTGSNGLKLRVEGSKSPIIWLSEGNREMTVEEMEKLDPNTIESITVLKDNALSEVPDNIKAALAGREYSGVVIIELKKGSAEGVPTITKRRISSSIKTAGDFRNRTEIKTLRDRDARVIIVKSKNQGEPFIWLSNEKREISLEDMNAIDVNNVESLSVMKDGNYPEDIKKAMGDRKFNGVLTIELKENGGDNGRQGEVTVKTTPRPAPFYWSSGKKRELTKKEMDKLGPKKIKSIIKLSPPYADEITAAMGGRKYGDVLEVQTK